MRAPMVIRWPGVIKPGTVQERDLRRPRLAAHVRQHRRRPKGDEAQEADRGRQVPGDRQDHARRRGSARLPGRASRDKSARDTFFYYSGRRRRRCGTRTGRCTTPCVSRPAGWLHAARPFHWPRSVNIKRDPFETAIGRPVKTAHRSGRRSGRPRDRLCLRLEHAAHRPGAVAEGTREPTFRSRRCRIRRATTSNRSSSRSRRRRRLVEATSSSRRA